MRFKKKFCEKCGLPVEEMLSAVMQVRAQGLCDAHIYIYIIIGCNCVSAVVVAAWTNTPMPVFKVKNLPIIKGRKLCSMISEIVIIGQMKTNR